MSQTKVLTNEVLKGIMTNAMVYRGVAKVLEDCTLPGYYSVDGNTTSRYPPNIPNWNFGILEVYQRNTELITRLSHIDGIFVLTRVYRQGTWRPWRQIAMTEI